MHVSTEAVKLKALGERNKGSRIKRKTLKKTGFNMFSMWRDELTWKMEVASASPAMAAASSGMRRGCPTAYGTAVCR